MTTHYPPSVINVTVLNLDPTGADIRAHLGGSLEAVVYMTDSGRVALIWDDPDQAESFAKAILAGVAQIRARV